jgi:hypothetical protein
MDEQDRRAFAHLVVGDRLAVDFDRLAYRHTLNIPADAESNG